MGEKIIFYEVGTGKRYEDYFPLLLDGGLKFYWKNFGQRILVKDGDEEPADIRDRETAPIKIEGNLIIRLDDYNEEFFEDTPMYPWYINAYDMCYEKEEGLVVLDLYYSDVIRIISNKKWNSRSTNTPEQDYYYWEGQWAHIDEYAKKTKQITDDAINSIDNWRRPKLATNAQVKMVVFQNEKPRFVGILESEKRKTVIDASFRLLYTLEYIDWSLM